MQVKVLGAGCANCHTLESRTGEALAQLGIDSEIEMITDFGQIAALGVMTTPALLVDDQIVMSGRVPGVEEIADAAMTASGGDYNVYVPLDNALGALGKEDGRRKVTQRMNEVLEEHLQKMPEDARARTLLAVNYAKAGREEDAMREANMAMTLRPDESTVLYNVACIFGLMQKKDKAIDALRKAWKAGFTDADWVRRDSDLTILHDHPEFNELYPPLDD